MEKNRTEGRHHPPADRENILFEEAADLEIAVSGKADAPETTVSEERTGADTLVRELEAPWRSTGRFALPEGTILDGRYRILRVIGQGGFGITYEAVHVRSEKHVAVKEYFCRDFCSREMTELGEKLCSVCILDDTLADQFRSDLDRFLKEARTLHDYASEPAIVTVLDYFEENATAYIVMEYLDGTTLRDYIRKNGRWDMEQAVRAFAPVMEAMEHVHAGGVIHRDISPDNLMVMPDGTLRLLDFGAARKSTGLQTTHSVIYKAYYSAPEQRDEKGVLGSWTDVYGICSSLYYCITGKEPEDVLTRLLSDSMDRPSALGAVILPQAERTLMKGMELDRKNRVQDMKQLRTELEKVYPRQTEAEKRRGKARRKRRIRILSAAAAVLILLAAGTAWTFRTQILFRFIDTEVTGLDGSDMSPEVFEESAARVRDRVRTLAGEGRFLWKEEEGQQIRFTVPAQVYGDVDPAAFVRAAISRPMVIRVYVKDQKAAEAPGNDSDGEVAGKTADSTGEKTGEGAGEEADTSGEKPDEGAREEPDTSGEKTGKEAGEEAADSTGEEAGEEAADSTGEEVGQEEELSFRELGIFDQEETMEDLLPGEGEAGGMILRLTEEGCRRFDGALDTEGLEVLMTFDEFDESGYRRAFYVSEPGVTMGDGRCILLPDDPDADLHISYALQRKRLLEAPSPAAFGVQSAWQVRWEDPEHTILPGTHQCRESEIPDPSVCLRYRSYSEEGKEDRAGYAAALLSFQAILKNRLDAIGIPYAVGVDVHRGSEYIVQVPMEGVFLEELESLGGYFFLYPGSERTPADRMLMEQGLRVIRDENGSSFEIAVTFNQYSVDNVTEALDVLAAQGREEVFLYLNHMPVAAGSLTEAYRTLREDQEIRFTRWAMSELGDMDAETVHFADYLSVCLEQDTQSTFHLDASEYRGEDGTIEFFNEDLPPEADRNPGTLLVEKWKEREDVKAGRLSASASSDYRTLSLNYYGCQLEDPARVLQAFADLYTEEDLDHTGIDSIYLYFYDRERGDPDSQLITLTLRMNFAEGRMLVDSGNLYMRDPEEEARLCEAWNACAEKEAFWKEKIGSGREEPVFQTSEN